MHVESRYAKLYLQEIKSKRVRGVRALFSSVADRRVPSARALGARDPSQKSAQNTQIKIAKRGVVSLHVHEESKSISKIKRSASCSVLYTLLCHIYIYYFSMHPRTRARYNYVSN